MHWNLDVCLYHKSSIKRPGYLMVVIPSPSPLPSLPILCRVAKIDQHGPANQWFKSETREMVWVQILSAALRCAPVLVELFQTL